MLLESPAETIPCVLSVWQVLLVSSSRHPDQWIVPGGGMEPEEDPCGAAVREVFEEVTVTPAAEPKGPRPKVLRAHPCILGVPCPSAACTHAQSETPRRLECHCGSFHHVSQLNLAPGSIRPCLSSARCWAPRWDKVTLAKHAEGWGEDGMSWVSTEIWSRRINKMCYERESLLPDKFTMCFQEDLTLGAMCRASDWHQIGIKSYESLQELHLRLCYVFLFDYLERCSVSPVPSLKRTGRLTPMWLSHDLCKCEKKCILQYTSIWVRQKNHLMRAPKPFVHIFIFFHCHL